MLTCVTDASFVAQWSQQLPVKLDEPDLILILTWVWSTQWQNTRL